MGYIYDDMYYIIELCNGIKFAVNIYDCENLPEDTVGFTIVSPKGKGNVPKCYSVKMGIQFHDENDGLDKAHFNGDTIIVQENTSFARNYETLNAAFINSRAMHDVATR